MVEVIGRLDPVSLAIMGRCSPQLSKGACDSEKDPSLVHTKAIYPGQRPAGLSFSCYSFSAMS